MKRPWSMRVIKERLLECTKDGVAVLLRALHTAGWGSPDQGGVAAGPPDRLSILVSQTNYIGDAVFAVPLIQALQEDPHVRALGVLASPASARVFSRVVGDGCLTVPFPITACRIGLVAGVIRRIRQGGFDVALCLDSHPNGLILAFLARVPTRIGFCGGNPPGTRASRYSFLYTASLPLDRDGQSRSDQGLSLLRFLGLRRPASFEGLRPSQDDLSEATNWLGQMNIEEGDTLVTIHPGARVPPKRWPAECWAEVIRELRAIEEITVVLVGGPADEHVLTAIGALVPQHVPVWRPASIWSVGALAARSAVFVGAESGPFHLAAALGARCVGLYSYADPSIFAPLGGRSVIVRSPIRCEGCWPDNCSTNACINAIKPRTVMNAIRQQLACL